jgi:steroid 5-alpha reductase family enzyme
MAGVAPDTVGLIVLAVLMMSAAMTFAWAVQRRTGNSGWIDTIWSASTGVTAAVILGFSGPMTPHRLAILALVAAWSARLASHIAKRTLGAQDDPRYRALMDDWGPTASRKLWQFLQVQAVAGCVLVASLAVAAAKPGGITLWDIACYALALIALAGESTADAQLSAFKARNKDRTAILDTGLWALSRHPNYFFEWLFWLAIALSALSLDLAGAWGWLALLAPAMMYFLLIYASGVPHAEAHMLRTRGGKFADYQRRVPMFFLDPRRLFGGPTGDD